LIYRDDGWIYVSTSINAVLEGYIPFTGQRSTDSCGLFNRKLVINEPSASHLSLSLLIIISRHLCITSTLFLRFRRFPWHFPLLFPVALFIVATLDSTGQIRGDHPRVGVFGSRTNAPFNIRCLVLPLFLLLFLLEAGAVVGWWSGVEHFVNIYRRQHQELEHRERSLRICLDSERKE
jgi:hypothetical protein